LERSLELGLNGKRVELKGISKTIFYFDFPNWKQSLKNFLNGIKPKQKQAGKQNVRSKTEAKNKQNRS
jgi:hypothetical protein